MYLVLHGRVLFLAGRIENVEQRRAVVDHGLLTVAVLCAPTHTRQPFALLLMTLAPSVRPQHSRQRATERTDGRVIVLEKVVCHETDGERRLADAAAAQHDLKSSRVSLQWTPELRRLRAAQRDAPACTPCSRSYSRSRVRRSVGVSQSAEAQTPKGGGGTIPPRTHITPAGAV